MCNEFTEADLDRAGMQVGRRRFAAIAGVGALAAALPLRAGAGTPFVDRDVKIETADGTCDAYFVAPATGRHPVVLIWPDIRGLRPAFRHMAKRLAGDGYAVLVVNPFYRSRIAPVVQAGDQFSDPEIRKRLSGYARLLDKAAVQRDATTYLAFLDAQAETDTARKIGTTGYCLGGAFTIFTAAISPERVGAAGSFHGGGLATEEPDSPHLMIPGTEAAYLFAIADNDDAKNPEEKSRLKAVLAPREQWHEVVVYEGAMHGWCVPDGRAYDEAAAEKAWSRMLAMFAASL